MSAWRIARADLRAGRKHSIAAIAVMALGVGAMSGVGAVEAEFARLLGGDSRQWLAADLAIEIQNPPPAPVLDSLRRQTGATLTWSTETIARALPEDQPDPLLVTVRAVEPQHYPFYGSLLISPQMPLWNALADTHAIVSATTRMEPGARFRLGRADFTVSALLVSEPDRFAAVSPAYPRILLSRAGFIRSGLARMGSQTFDRLLLKLPEYRTVDTARSAAEEMFPDSFIADYRQADPRVSEAFDAGITGLSLLGWMALVLGSAGAGMIFYLHLDARLDSVAILKALGGRNAMVMGAYLIEASALACCAGVGGVAIGRVIQLVLLHVASSQLSFRFPAEFPAGVSMAAVILAWVSVLLVCAGSIWRLRSVAPLLALRREMGESPLRWPPLFPVAGAGFLLLAIVRMRSLRVGSAALAAMVICIGSAWLASRGALYLVSRLYRGAPLPMAIRFGLGNLRRPGNRSEAIAVVLTLCLLVAGGAALIPGNVERIVMASLPVPRGELIAFGLNREGVDALRQALARHGDWGATTTVSRNAVLQLTHAGGRPVDELRRIQRRWVVSCVDRTTGLEEVVLSDIAASGLGVAPGASLRFHGGGRPIAVRVRAVRRLDAIENLRHSIEFACPALEGVPQGYAAGIEVAADREREVRSQLSRELPSVPLVSRTEFQSTVSGIARRIVWALGAVSTVTAMCGVALAALLTASARRRRLRETAIVKAIGGTPRQVRLMLGAEFAALGIIAGTLSCLLSSAFASLMLSVVFRRFEFAWDGRLLLLIPGVTLLAVVVGEIAGRDALRLRPLLAMRTE